MGLFYAYLKNEITSPSYDNYILVFADREAADEWWRMISTPPSPYAASVQRISPQFYIQSTGERNVTIFYSCSELSGAKQLGRKVYIMTANYSIPKTIPSITITDHISGRWYFIRSKADPWSHWYLRIKGECLACGDADCDAVHVSSEHRTKFCIRVRSPVDGPQIPRDFVMIGRDEILIAAPKGYILHAKDEEDLKATMGYQGETDLVFGDLKDRFITRAEKQVSGEIWEYVESVEKGLGEDWELVN